MSWRKEQIVLYERDGEHRLGEIELLDPVEQMAQVRDFYTSEPHICRLDELRLPTRAEAGERLRPAVEKARAIEEAVEEGAFLVEVPGGGPN